MKFLNSTGALGRDVEGERGERRAEQRRAEDFFPPSFDVLVRYNFPLNLGMSKNIVEARLFHLTGEGKHVYGSKGRSAK